MDTDKTLGSKATDLYCQIAEIENLVTALSFAAIAEDVKLGSSSEISWGGLFDLIRKELNRATLMADSLECDIRNGGQHA
ncbi:hypothetical protein KAR91_08475 [Candidatus Pacearchaeota archaeon]|nr:hypothetical protein [Candidatus Pacearchaeota archaeon]